MIDPVNSTSSTAEPADNIFELRDSVDHVVRELQESPGDFELPGSGVLQEPAFPHGSVTREQLEQYLENNPNYFAGLGNNPTVEAVQQVLNTDGGLDLLNKSAQLTGLPNTESMSTDEKYQLYSNYIDQNGSDEARQQLAGGEKVVLSLRGDTDINANDGRGEYDDRMVVLQNGPDGPMVEEYSANLDPSAQYEGSVGVDADGDSRLDQGRLADGTYVFSRGMHLGGDAFRSTNDQIAERDTNHDGSFGESVQSPEGNYGMHIHVGSNNDTDSAGCLTLAPGEFSEFMNIMGDSSQLTNVVVSVGQTGLA